MPVLSKNQKRLRAVNKKIRLAKPAEGEWNLAKIEDLEKERDMISERILVDKKKQKAKEDFEKAKEDFEKMTADEALEYFKEEKMDTIENHSIPNTPHTRRLRKTILENLNQHMMSEMMNQQMRVRINIINQLKTDCKIEEEEIKEQQEFLEVKKFLQENLTS
tara:strand:+ start:114 stop:602 length:489 start_codon:yes stop_codon:yes gene_type:complete